ncbi:hypothetical protein OAC89_03735 [Deltaproteobacteria bacterium]|nr:hypothetical protein [Deltaproteobacteria bacterium]
MRTVFFYFMLLLGLIALDASAGEIRQINLNDGSTINAEILSLNDGIYTLKSFSLGTVNIQESEVHSITSVENIKQEIQGFTQKIMNDAELLNIILPLQDDPDFKTALEDPSILEAVTSGDMNALLSNPKFIKLLNNPRILNIRDKIID